MLVNRPTYFLKVSACSAAATSVREPLATSLSSHEKNSHRATASLISIKHRIQNTRSIIWISLMQTSAMQCMTHVCCYFTGDMINWQAVSSQQNTHNQSSQRALCQKRPRGINATGGPRESRVWEAYSSTWGRGLSYDLFLRLINACKWCCQSPPLRGIVIRWRVSHIAGVIPCNLSSTHIVAHLSTFPSYNVSSQILSTTSTENLHRFLD